jgi:hypothetical protein
VDEGEIAFVDVEVGTADTAGEDAEEDVAFGDRRARDLFDLKEPIWGS